MKTHLSCQPSRIAKPEAKIRETLERAQEHRTLQNMELAMFAAKVKEHLCTRSILDLCRGGILGTSSLNQVIGCVRNRRGEDGVEQKR